MERKPLDEQIRLASHDHLNRATEIETSPLFNEGSSSNVKNHRDVLTMAAAAALNRRSRARHLHSADNGSSDGEGTMNTNPLEKTPADEKDGRLILSLAATAALERRVNVTSLPWTIDNSGRSDVVGRVNSGGRDCLHGAILPTLLSEQVHS